MSLIHNERTKLSATALNGVAIASIVAGLVTPIAALTFGMTAPGGRSVPLTMMPAWLGSPSE